METARAGAATVKASSVEATRTKSAAVETATTAMVPNAHHTPVSRCMSGKPSKFMPKKPVMNMSGKNTVDTVASFFIMSFWR